jgi:hypothetical protein
MDSTEIEADWYIVGIKTTSPDAKHARAYENPTQVLSPVLSYVPE